MQEPEVQLGWLIERKERKVDIYRPDLEMECLDHLDLVSDDLVLPRFVLNTNKVW